MPYRFHHAAHLSVASLVNRDLQQGGLRVRIEINVTHFGGSRYAVHQLDALFQLVCGFAFHEIADTHFVHFGNVVARVGQAVCKVAIVREKEQTFTVHIKTTYRVKASWHLRHQFHDGVVRVRVRHRRGVPDGFIQGYVLWLGLLSRKNRLAFHADIIG